MEKKIFWIYWFKDDGIILFLKYSFFNEKLIWFGVNDDILNLMKKLLKLNYIFIVWVVLIYCLYLFFFWIYMYKVIMVDILFIFKLVCWVGGFKII